MRHQASGLIRRARAGVGGIAQAASSSFLAATARPAVLGIVSGKGGVGKSTLAVNLATGVAGLGARTLLIDGDIGLANADLLMGLVPDHELSDWSAGRVELRETICPGPAGLDLMIAGSDAHAVAGLSQALAGGAASGLGGLLTGYDLCVLDLGAGIGEAVLDLARLCGPVWLVATPEPTSLADAYATAKRLWERAQDLEIELIVNRARDRESGERTHQALERLTRRFLSRALPLRAVLPEDPAMLRAVARQQAVVLGESGAPVARRLSMLAQSLLEERAQRGDRSVSDVAPGVPS